MKQAKATLPSGEYLIQEVPDIAIASSIFLNMGYLVYKAWDKSKFITDEEILEDGIRFLTTGKSKYSKAVIGDSLKGAAAKLPPGNWKLLGADPTNLTEEEAGEIVESWPSVSGEAVRVYQRYPDEIPKCRTAIGSLNSLAASLGISKPYVILKNVEK